MICKYCGTTLNDNATYCNRCGNPTNAGGQVQPGKFASPIQQNIYVPQQTKQPISVGGWIGRSLIPCIPLVGGLVYLIMLFVWSGDTAKEDSFRNWAKAQLIVMGVAVALALLIVLIVVVGVGSAR